MGFILEGVKYKDILDIDRLELLDKQVTCIVGESGSGKTTLLRLLNNLISADSGRVTYQGINVDETDPVELRRKIAMLPQIPTIFPGTVGDNLRLGLDFAGQDQVPEETLLEALEMAKLRKSLTSDAADLSGGEKQRLALARILLLRPEVLLLDEPSSALDDETEKLVIESIVEHTRKREITLIMVTHSKAVAETFGDTVVTIHNGRVAGIKEAPRA
ncbi:MAG: ATP-binding cassette domain-containing protein [Firmicutes bacterium]|nr:ATP-binding cassette domain-containing protein [Bacillota bacterium]